MKLRWNINVNSESLFIIHILLTLKLWINEDKNSVLRSNMLFMNEISFWEHTNGMSVQKLKTVGYGKNKSKFPNSGTLELYNLAIFHTILIIQVALKMDIFLSFKAKYFLIKFPSFPTIENLRALKLRRDILFSLPPPKKWKSKFPYFPKFPNIPHFLT